jgi:DNA-directed RNA polymerase sigma subunit (sigma70/sigma32)
MPSNKGHRVDVERAVRLLREREKWSLQRIGRLFGVSRQRIHQLLKVRRE